MNESRRPLEAVPGLSVKPGTGPSRTAAIPGPPKGPRPRGSEPAAPVETTRPAPEREKGPDVAPRPAPSTPSSGPRSQSAATVRPIGLSLPSSLLAQLRERARSTGVTQPDLLMDAISATHEQLQDLVSPAQDAPVKDGMFLRRPSVRTVEPLATLTLRMLAPNVAVIDELVASTGASSRSALCSAALRHYLTEH